MKPRKFILESEIKIFLGKDSKSNDKLMTEYKGKENTILHTIKSGSPFCVIDSLNFSKTDLKEAAIICASKSQDWRDNKKSVKLHVFTGKDLQKNKTMKQGTWRIKGKAKTIKAKKRDIIKWQLKNSN
ncbi:MAG: NFACT RNA binding domain-containing protein [Nanoarchaeota archaeon]|nr:NFACT RNA binding domain-containing protein [Nanoarchaeota archaeon]